MKIILIILVIAIIVFTYHFYPFYKAVRTSTDIEKKASRFEQHPTQPTIKILVAGDSTGVGTGATMPEDSTAGQLGKKYPTADITNISQNGLKLEGLESKLKNTEQTYDLILIQIGANDIVQQTDNKKIEETLNSVLQRATSKSKKVILLTAGNVGLSPVFKSPISNILTFKTKEVRNIFIKTVTQYPTVTYVDLFKEKSEDIFITDVKKYYAADRFHPSSEGYKVWFTEIEKSL